MNLFLLRHAKSLRSKIGMWGRRYNADLDPDYLHDVKESKAVLSKLQEVDVFSSPLIRCINTLKVIVEEKQQIILVDELTAYHSGFFEDKSEAYIREKYPDYLTKTFSEKFCLPQYEEEGIFQQTERILSGFEKLLLQSSKKSIIISTHFSVINVIANFANENFDKLTYADGRFDVKEGDFICIQLNKEVALNNIKKYGK